MTAERYTAVFTGLFTLKKPGEYPHLTMHSDPMGTGTYGVRHGKPPLEKMGFEISFAELPEGCRRLVIETYLELWNL